MGSTASQLAGDLICHLFQSVPVHTRRDTHRYRLLLSSGERITPIPRDEFRIFSLWEKLTAKINPRGTVVLVRVGAKIQVGSHCHSLSIPSSINSSCTYVHRASYAVWNLSQDRQFSHILAKRSKALRSFEPTGGSQNSSRNPTIRWTSTQCATFLKLPQIGESGICGSLGKREDEHVRFSVSSEIAPQYENCTYNRGVSHFADGWASDSIFVRLR